MTDIWDEKPEAHIYCLLSYKKEEMDAWIGKLVMDYETKLHKMYEKASELHELALQSSTQTARDP